MGGLIQSLSRHRRPPQGDKWTLLAAWRVQLLQPRRDTLLITFLPSLTSWTPLSLQEAIPAIRTIHVITDSGLPRLNLMGPATLSAAPTGDG